MKMGARRSKRRRQGVEWEEGDWKEEENKKEERVREELGLAVFVQVQQLPGSSLWPPHWRVNRSRKHSAGSP